MPSDVADLTREIAVVERSVDASRRQLVATAKDTSLGVRTFAGQWGGGAMAFALSAFVGALVVGPRKTRRRR